MFLLTFIPSIPCRTDRGHSNQGMMHVIQTYQHSRCPFRTCWPHGSCTSLKSCVQHHTAMCTSLNINMYMYICTTLYMYNILQCSWPMQYSTTCTYSWPMCSLNIRHPTVGKSEHQHLYSWPMCTSLTINILQLAHVYKSDHQHLTVGSCVQV